MSHTDRTRAGWALVSALLAMLVLAACSGGGGTRGGAAEGGSEEAFALSPGEMQQLARFDEVVTEYASDPQDTRSRKHFRDAYARIQTVYVRPVPGGELVDAAIGGVRGKDASHRAAAAADLVEQALDAMTASLDPHSTYLNPEELRDAEVAISGRFGGLGIQVAREEGRIKIISPIEGTPADRAGLKPGDVITEVDGKAVSDLTLSQAVQAMRGDPGTRIRLRVERQGRKPFDVTITRAVIDIQPVRWSTFDDVGYIRIVSFNERAAEELSDAIDEIRDELGDALKGIVLDLRSNPGGLFNQSVRIADAFLDDGIIVAIRGRDDRPIRGYRASDGDLAEGLPMVVLINSGSASASEIVASALQDHKRAIVMGTPSFGKGSVQTVIRLPEEGALKLTTALYYAPSGRAIQARGVQPDIRLTNTGDAETLSREVDLPHALPALGDGWTESRARIDAGSCRALGKREDREIGCAVGLLQAGSLETFLSRKGVARAARGDG